MVRRLKQMRLRSSMVEQATHNRQVTGSNPVGATFYAFGNLDPGTLGLAILACAAWGVRRALS